MPDAVDVILDAWRRERPDVDPWPIGVVGRVQRLSRWLSDGVAEFMARHGLDLGEADLLTTLRRTGEPYELTARALVRASLVTSGAITKRVDRMEARGLVRRIPDPDDGRVVRIRLTPHGRGVIDGLFAGHVANEARLVAALGPDRAEALAGLLRELLESLGDASPA